MSAHDRYLEPPEPPMIDCPRCEPIDGEHGEGCPLTVCRCGYDAGNCHCDPED